MSDYLSVEQANTLQATMEAYWLALGRFVSEFADVERSIQILLRDEAGVSISVGAAVFSGVKTDQATSLLRRINDLNKNEHWYILERAFQQLSIINNVRNDILHYGITHFDDGKPVVTNFINAHIEERLRRTPISHELLEDMTSDLGIIIAHIGLYNHHRHNFPGRPVWTHVLQIPWRYKQSAQGSSHPKSRKKTRTRATQPTPSGE